MSRARRSLAAGCLVVACASPRAAAPPAHAPASHATRSPPTTPAARDAPTTPPAATPAAARDHTIAIDGLPEGFAALSPRDRERWHACHIFFLGDHDTGAPTARYAPTPGSTYRPPPQQHLGFSVTPDEYVAEPEATRREFLVRRGCPASLVDLADGSHLDLIEHP